MNKIYRVIWSKTKNCYVVASELAKRHTKAPQSGVVNKIAALALVGAMSFGFAGSAWAAIPEGTARGDGAIAVGDLSVANGVYSLAVGAGAETGFTDSENIIDVKASHAAAVGPHASAQAMYSSVFGAYSGITVNPAKTANIGNKKGKVLQGFGATVLGSLNSSSTSNDGPMYASVANSIVGVANIATDSNGALIYGAGNAVTNSYQDVIFDGNETEIQKLVDLYDEAVNEGDRTKMAQVAAKLRGMVKVSGGQVMAFGGQNTADYAYRSQIIGVGNELTGSDDVGSITIDGFTYKKYDTEYDLLDGFENKVGSSSHVSVIGTGNNVQQSDNNVIVGDYHGLTGGGNNVIIGSYKPTATTANDNSSIGSKATKHTDAIEDTVMLGHNADVTISQGTALGAYSLANTGADVAGFDPTTGLASTRASAAWKSTAAAVSVGNESRKTWFGFSNSQITTFKNSHKDELRANGINPDLAPKALLESLNDEQMAFLLQNINNYETEVSDSEPEKAGTVYVAQPGGGTTRQITNVAAGFKDTDAVNVAQLKSVTTHYYSVNDNGHNELGNYNNDGAAGEYGVAAGVDASAQGFISTVVGANSKAIDPMGGVLSSMQRAASARLAATSWTNFGLYTALSTMVPVIQAVPSVTSAGATVIGSLNTVDINSESKNLGEALTTAFNNSGGTAITTNALKFLRGANLFDGVSNTMVGNLNTTTDANVAVIYGTGNSITNSYENFETGFDAFKDLTDAQIDSIVQRFKNYDIQPIFQLVQPLLNMQDAKDLKQAIIDGDFETMKRVLKKYISEGQGKGGRSIAIGTNNKIQNAKQAIAFGTNNNVTGDKSIAVGIGHTISGANSGAFGDPSTISGNNSYAIGNDNTIAVNDAFVLGNDAQATADNAVALGNKSIAGAAATVNGYDPVTGAAHVLGPDEVDDLQIQSVWKATAGTVSVGGGTMKRMNEQGEYLNESGSVVQGADQAADIPVTRQITNVAAGSALTDAVNVAQLMAAQVEIVAGDNVEVIKENSNGHTKYTIHSLNAMIAEKGENITVTADTPETTEETNGKTTDLTAEGDGTTGGSGSTGDTGGTTAEPTPSPEGEQITPSGTNNHTTTYTINATDTRNTVKAGENITVKEKNNDDGSITYTISAQAATNVKVIDGENTTVTEGKDGDFTTYAVNVKTDGEVASGNTGIVTGDTVYNETRVKKDGNYIKKDNTAAENITELDKRLGENTQNITNIYNDVNNMDNRMKKGLAGAAALAALHPMDFNPDDKLQFSAGVGNYRGETAAALGMFYRPDESVMFSIGGTFGNSDNMINAGITFGLDGTRNRITRSRTAMAREIQDLRSLVTQMAARMDRLEGVNIETAMFPDVPENHWAYEYVEDLQRRGALKGYPDGLFKGDRAMTRYEFAAMLDRLVRSGVTLDSKIAKEFEPELGRIYVERISGQDNDRKKVERVRVNNSDSKYPEGKTRDVYGSKIVTEAPKTAEAK